MDELGPGMLDVAASAARLLIGVVLLSASAAKLFSIQGFASILLQFPISRSLLHGPQSAVPAAFVILSAEASLGLLFLLGVAIHAVGALILGLFAAFSVALAIAVARGEDIRCGCFGSSPEDRVETSSLYRNILLLGFTALGMSSSSLTLEAVLAARAPIGQWLAAVAIGAQASVLILLGGTFTKIRARPNYVRHVPPIEPRAIDTIWKGARVR